MDLVVPLFVFCSKISFEYHKPNKKWKLGYKDAGTAFRMACFFKRRSGLATTAPIPTMNVFRPKNSSERIVVGIEAQANEIVIIIIIYNVSCGTCLFVFI